MFRSHANFDICEDVVIMDYCILGERNPYPDVFENQSERIVSIGDKTIISSYTVLFEGARIANNVQIGERCTIGSCTQIGHHCRLIYGAQVHDNVTVGQCSIIGGFIADNCTVGERCHVFGSLVHRYDTPDPSAWDETDEIGPTLEDNVVIGWGAVIVGPIRIGADARIRPNAVVTRDIMPGERYGSS